MLWWLCVYGSCFNLFPDSTPPPASHPNYGFTWSELKLFQYKHVNIVILIHYSHQKVFKSSTFNQVFLNKFILGESSKCPTKSGVLGWFDQGFIELYFM